MKIAIFYHLLQTGMSAFIYQSQIHRLYASGLLKEAKHFHIGINGSQELFNLPETATVSYNQDLTSEKSTLLSLRDFCKENPDYKVLYFHSKGATKETLTSQSWRLMMEYFVIDRWKECIEYLNEYDCVGPEMEILGPTLWSDGSITQNDPTPFFIGNFWWANATYVNTIRSRYLESDDRMEKERWIGDGEFGCKAKNLYKSGFDGADNPYHYYFKESSYVS